MKMKNFLLVILIFACVFIDLQSLPPLINQCDIVPYVNEIGRCGYTDSFGNMKIKPLYKHCSDFDGDIAWAQNDSNKIGLIDTNGVMLTTFKYDFVYDFYGQSCTPVLVNSERTIFSRFKKKQYGWGYVNRDGIEIVPCSYMYVFVPSLDNDEEYDNNGVLFCEDRKGRFGMFNSDGNLLFPFEYERMHSLFKGFCYAKKKDSSFVLSKSGRKFSVSEYESVGFFDKKGYSIVRKKVDGMDKYGVIDTIGQKIYPCIYEDKEKMEKMIGRKW